MGKYEIITNISKKGAHISKLILHMPFEVNSWEVNSSSFNVYGERRDLETKEVVTCFDFIAGRNALQKGYVTPENAYVCDAQGNPAESSSYIALELPITFLNSRIAGSLLENKFVENVYRITQVNTIGKDPVKSGCVFDECIRETVYGVEGWKMDSIPDGLKYAYYDPTPETKVPVVVWLHGAGEGGQDPRTTFYLNNVISLHSNEIQGYLGGKSYVLTPQSPTVWMDDGVKHMGRSNISIYVKQLKECIDTFY